MSSSEGRFYEAEFPELDDVVVVQVRRIVDMGAYCSLLEYDGREGMLLLSELSKRRIRSVAKLLRVGRTEVCMILRVDKDKGYIDLSKRRVEPEDATAKEEKFAKAKAVHGIMRHVASTNGIPVEELCNKISWPLHKKHPDVLEIFRRHINDEMDLWKQIDWSQPGDDLTVQKTKEGGSMVDKVKEDIEINLRRRLISQIVRLRAKIEVSCSDYEGIDAVKSALTAGYEASKEECEVKINLVAHPLFVLTCTCRDKAKGLEALDQAIELIKVSIEKQGGAFALKSKPELMGANDDHKEVESDSEGGSGEESDFQEDMGELDEEALKKLEAMKLDDDDK